MYNGGGMPDVAHSPSIMLRGGGPGPGPGGVGVSVVVVGREVVPIWRRGEGVPTYTTRESWRWRELSDDDGFANFWEPVGLCEGSEGSGALDAPRP